MIARVDFQPQDFEQLIQQKGYRLLWEKAINCPCVDPDTGRAVKGCPQCDSRGKFYFDSKEIKGVITRQNKELQIGDAIGVLEPGDAYLTTSASNRLAIYDRVTNLDSSLIEHETVIHDDAYGDWLTFPAVGSIEVAAYQPTRTSNIVIFKQDTDYRVAVDGKIEWLGANKPTNGHGVSFRYYHHPVWLVTNTINAVRDTFVKEGNPIDTATQMPVRVQIRLESLGTAISNG